MTKLHENAADAYNKKMEPLVLNLKPYPRKPPQKPEGEDTYVAESIGASDIVPGTFREYQTDYTGERTSCYFDTQKGFWGISGADHEVLVKVVRRIAGNPVYREALSEEFIYERAIRWLQNKVEKSEAPTSFTDFIEDAASQAVSRFEVWIPVPSVQINRPFNIGRTTFRRITKQMLDDLSQRNGTKSSPKQEVSFDRLRSRIQKATAACIEVEAEPIRANEIALRESETSIGILRLACPVMLNPHEWLPVDPTNIDRLGASFVLHVKDSKIIRQNNALHKRMSSPWILNDNDIEHYFKTWWSAGHNLIVIQRNEFQETLLSALLHYSKSLLKPDIAERLLYIVTALESLLIKDSGESIVQNLRERMAVLSGPEIKNRLKVLEVISSVYDMRSGFVHRATPVFDLSGLEAFFKEAWVIMLFLFNNYNKWNTKADFLRSVDSHKFTGPMFSTADMPDIHPNQKDL